jgi:hypothetical protein
MTMLPQRGSLDEISAQEVRELLDYDPATGVFTWRKDRRGKAKVGDRAGSVVDGGYTLISINDRLYKAHRLAWLLVHGEWPAVHIDHINRDGSDNRISNLRLVSDAENAQNVVAQKNSKTGIRGVSWKKSSGKWCAQVSKNRKIAYIAYFDNIADAERAVIEARRKIHPFSQMDTEGSR